MTALPRLGEAQQCGTDGKRPVDVDRVELVSTGTIARCMMEDRAAVVSQRALRGAASLATSMPKRLCIVTCTMALLPIGEAAGRKPSISLDMVVTEAVEVETHHSVAPTSTSRVLQLTYIAYGSTLDENHPHLGGVDMRVGCTTTNARGAVTRARSSMQLALWVANHEPILSQGGKSNDHNI